MVYISAISSKALFPIVFFHREPHPMPLQLATSLRGCSVPAIVVLQVALSTKVLQGSILVVPAIMPRKETIKTIWQVTHQIISISVIYPLNIHYVIYPHYIHYIHCIPPSYCPTPRRAAAVARAPFLMATTEAASMALPSAMGSLKGTPSSMTSAPIFFWGKKRGTSMGKSYVSWCFFLI